MVKEKENPAKRVWEILNIPFSVLGILSISESVISFQQNIALVINAYKSFSYPIFDFLFSWAWFYIPTWIYDYLFVGVLFSTSVARSKGFARYKNTLTNETFTVSDTVMPKWIKKYGFKSLITLTLVLLIKQTPRFIYHVLFWPFPVTNMLYLIRNTHENGLFKDTKGIKVKYLWRDEDVFVFQYLAAVFILFIVVIIVNFSIHLIG